MALEGNELTKQKVMVFGGGLLLGAALAGGLMYFFHPDIPKAKKDDKKPS